MMNAGGRGSGMKKREMECQPRSVFAFSLEDLGFDW